MPCGNANSPLALRTSPFSSGFTVEGVCDVQELDIAKTWISRQLSQVGLRRIVKDFHPFRYLRAWVRIPQLSKLAAGFSSAQSLLFSNLVRFSFRISILLSIVTMPSARYFFLLPQDCFCLFVMSFMT